MPMLNVGDIVVHTARPEWKAGKVLEVTASQVKVVFPDGQFQDGGGMIRPFRADESRLILAPEQNNVRLEHLSVDLTGKTLRVTFEQGLRSFQHHFANFNDPRYLGSKTEGERTYKELASKAFQELLGADRLRTLVDERNAQALRLALREVQKPVSNLLHSTEVSRLSEAEQNDDACISFGAALDELLRAETLNEQVFERYVRTARLFVESAKSGGPFTWPLATFFPYLAAPDRFMFLKPETSRECANRLQFDLKYDSRPNWQTYERLLLLSNDLLERLGPLGARDFIDVQSFMFVVENYETESGSNKL